MTQLGELQDAMPKFREAGIKVYAVSYDEQDALAAFAAARGIEYLLLSDRDSAVIRQLGILNTRVDEADVPFYGIPVPGTYLLGEDGVVIEKFFPRHLANRESAETLIDSALGEILRAADEPSVAGGSEDVRITAFLRGGGGVIKSGIKRRVVVRFELRDGLHIYGEPVPEGMVATRVEIEGPEGFHVEAPTLPPTQPLHLEALGADLRVWSGTVDLAFPVWVNSKVVGMSSAAASDELELRIRVRYQACDDRTCLIPRTEELHLRVPIGRIDAPNLPMPGFETQHVTTMNSGEHFGRLVQRGRGANKEGG